MDLSAIWDELELPGPFCHGFIRNQGSSGIPKKTDAISEAAQGAHRAISWAAQGAQDPRGPHGALRSPTHPTDPGKVLNDKVVSKAAGDRDVWVRGLRGNRRAHWNSISSQIPDKSMTQWSHGNSS